MTAKIKQSTVDSFRNFDLLVAEHAGALRHWRSHHEALKKQEADIAAGKTVKAIDRFQPFDRPRAADQIEAAINDKFEVDYEVVDDSNETLPLRKQALISRVLKLEGDAIVAIVPPGKQRLLTLQEAAIREADDSRMSDLMKQSQNPGFLKRLFGEGEIDFRAEVEKQRPAEDTAFLQNVQEIRRRLKQIEFMSAQAMAEIEDLTVDTIDGFQIPDFSGV